MGIKRTLLHIKQRFYWPNMDLDVTRWCAKCPECLSRKGKVPPSRIPMKTFPAGSPFDRIAMDILDTHKHTAKGNRYILVVSDYFTNYTDTFPLRRHTAHSVANMLVTRWITYHGVPSQILSDQGKEFEGHLFHCLGLRTMAYRQRFSQTRAKNLKVICSIASVN